jgi:hypothetical protein
MWCGGFPDLPLFTSSHLFPDLPLFTSSHLFPDLPLFTSSHLFSALPPFLPPALMTQYPSLVLDWGATNRSQLDLTLYLNNSNLQVTWT